jgi:hypothetical protein
MPAWSIGGGSLGSQLGYRSGTLTPQQQALISVNGFVLTVVARVIPVIAPTYPPVLISSAFFDTGTVRWEIGLGLDTHGDTVVVLPSSINNAGLGGVIGAPGVSYTLTGLGNEYEEYQLVEAPSAATADLFVNGTKVLSDYTGNTSFAAGSIGLDFGAYSGGQGNFNLVDLSTNTVVPEPASLAMFAVSLLGLGLIRRRHR